MIALGPKCQRPTGHTRRASFDNWPDLELVESKRDIHNPEGIEKPDAKYQDDDYTQDRLIIECFAPGEDIRDRDRCDGV